MGHRTPKVLVGVAAIVAMVASACGAVTSKPRTSGPVPPPLLVLGERGADADPAAGFCAGVLIGPKQVLTATRCLRKRKARSVNVRVLKAEGCLVRMRRRGVDATRASLGTASVVKLQAKVPPKAAAPLPRGDVPTGGDIVVAWGWGPGRPGGGCVPRPERLTVVSEEECADVVGEDRLSVYFCAVPEGDFNACPGDLGGPVLDEERRLVGLTVNEKKCGTDKAVRFWSTSNLVKRAS
ncbi:trypsin-like serine protease [Nocardioides coralli]|uniref:trypsin-like serine protease n=1 Tax=Nocardioides coralli TaxID=2872154 RepID=UPI001CA3F84D|nr:trypsin-like serine protease [Nocardioides coralli]QZY29708.1 trypsin-like serine protease [Nocardioides coralli]